MRFSTLGAVLAFSVFAAATPMPVDGAVAKDASPPADTAGTTGDASTTKTDAKGGTGAEAAGGKPSSSKNSKGNHKKTCTISQHVASGPLLVSIKMNDESFPEPPAPNPLQETLKTKLQLTESSAPKQATTTPLGKRAKVKYSINVKGNMLGEASNAKKIIEKAIEDVTQKSVVCKVLPVGAKSKGGKKSKKPKGANGAEPAGAKEISSTKSTATSGKESATKDTTASAAVPAEPETKVGKPAAKRAVVKSSE